MSLTSIKQTLRLIHIGYILARYDALFIFKSMPFSTFVTFWGHLIPRKCKKPEDLPEKKYQEKKYQGQCLREAFIALGPTFVKMGQILSVRSDLVGPDIADELSQLQDKMPKFSYEHSKKIIERDFKRPIDEVYTDFDPEPA